MPPRASYVHIADLARGVLASGVVGDFAEIGVWHGSTFLPLAELCRLNGRTIHAIDSFLGMAKETALDGNRFREGALSVCGSDRFRVLVQPFANVRIHEGYVPAILDDLAGVRFAFVHLDLDQHAPTLATLRFLWPRMAPGGVIAVHDWEPDSDILATRAVKDWMAESDVAADSQSLETGHIWFVRGDS